MKITPITTGSVNLGQANAHAVLQRTFEERIAEQLQPQPLDADSSGGAPAPPDEEDE